LQDAERDRHNVIIRPRAKRDVNLNLDLKLRLPHRRLVKRKLDACFTPEERVAVWEDAAKTAQDMADEQASRYEAGTVPEVVKDEGSEYQKEVELELGKSKFEAQQ
jgi:hypothetical protein